MLQQVKILTGRKAYEFHPDDIRISTLSIKPIQEQLQNLFQFQASAMATPMATFGEVPATYPPGFVFDMGVWLTPDEQQIVPIRFLHFEPRRIVIDVAGPSSTITPIYNHLQNFLSQLQAADGNPVIGEPRRILDYSEISAQFSEPLDAIFSPRIRKLLAKTMAESASGNEVVPVPTLVIQALSRGQEYAGTVNANEPHSFTLSQRAGSSLSESVYFSAAPLDSEIHLNYLNELEEALRF